MEKRTAGIDYPNVSLNHKFNALVLILHIKQQMKKFRLIAVIIISFVTLNEINAQVDNDDWIEVFSEKAEVPQKIQTIQGYCVSKYPDLNKEPPFYCDIDIASYRGKDYVASENYLLMYYIKENPHYKKTRKAIGKYSHYSAGWWMSYIYFNYSRGKNDYTN